MARMENIPVRQTTELTRLIELTYGDNEKRKSPFTVTITKEKGKETEQVKSRSPLVATKTSNGPVNSSSSSKPGTNDPVKAKARGKGKETGIVVRVDGKRFTTGRAFNAFWEYASERHAVELRRREGKPRPWSKKSVFNEYKFCSVFRVADRGSQFLIKEVIEKGSQEDEEILFRVLLYSSFVRVETYRLLEEELGPLSWKTYNHAKYAKVLLGAIDNGDSIYTGAFQKFPPQLGYRHAHENHLTLLEIMMNDNLLDQLKSCEYMADAFDVIYQYPGSGDFVAFQLLINLSYTRLVDFGEDDFVIAGVGAVKGLKKCFVPAELVGGSEEALIRWMMETQEEHFERLGLEPAVLTMTDGDQTKKRRMTLVDVEHTLCELHKYSRIVLSGGSAYGKRFMPKSTRLPRQPTLPRAWSCPSRQRTRLKPGRMGWERAEKVYVVNKILKKGETEEGEVIYFVDWLGYPESARTWEPRETLLVDAPVVVEEFEKTLEMEGKGANRPRKMIWRESVGSRSLEGLTGRKRTNSLIS